MAEEENTNKVEPIFKGIDETGIDFQYEEDINKLSGWFYGNSFTALSSNISSSIDPSLNEINVKLSNLGDGLDKVNEVLECMSKKSMYYVGVVDKEPTSLSSDDTLILIEDENGNSINQKLVPALNMMVEYEGREFLYRFSKGKAGWQEIGEENWNNSGSNWN